MNTEQAIKRTKKLSIIEAMFFNGFSVGMQSFVMMVTFCKFLLKK